MKQLLAAGALFVSMALPAHATEWMECSDGEKVNFRVLLGTMEVIAVNTIEIEVAGKKWSTLGGEGTTLITRGQAFETPDQMWIDVTDDNVNLIVAKLRVFKTFEDNAAEGMVADAKAGTLQMPGIGAWPMICSGP